MAYQDAPPVSLCGQALTQAETLWEQTKFWGARLFLTVLSTTLWVVSAQFTLVFLATSLQLPIASWGWWAWGIPVGLTLVELAWLPGKPRRVPLALWQKLIWLIVAVLDVGSTTLGAYPWVTSINLAGWSPAGNWAIGVTVMVGLVLSLVPEPLVIGVWKARRG